MLIRLPIIALLTLAQATVNTPGQRGEKQDRPTHNQSKGENINPPLAQPSFDLRVTIHDKEGGAKHNQPQNQTNDWIEAFWPAPLSNWMLVLVGGIAGYLALQTLRKIGRQADLMKVQSDLMKDQADLAKNKERPRLRIELEDIDLGPKREIKGWFLAKWKISIYGTTEAFIDGSIIHCCVGDKTGFIRPEQLDSGGLPQVIVPRSAPVESFAIIQRTDGLGPQEDDDLLEEVRQGRKLVYFFGHVKYSNVFGESWILPFDRQYETIQLDNGRTWGIWLNCPPPAQNTEYKVEQPQKAN